MENKRWMTAREVADRWGMADFELLDCFSTGLMAVNKKTGNWIFQITEPIKFKDETVGKIELLYEEDTTSMDQPPIPVSDKKKCTDWIFNGAVVFNLDHVLEFEVAHGLTAPTPVENVTTTPPTPTTTEQLPQDENYDPFSPEEQLRARRRTPAEQKELAKRMKAEGKTKKQVFERLFPHDMGHATTEALEKRVQRLWSS